MKEYQITYIDEVCQNSIYTDHSAIELTFRIKNYKYFNDIER